jgi:two-component system OmpR family sensor kinase
LKLRDRLSLRARLSIGLVAVVAVALAIANVSVYALASNFFNQRVDEQLMSLDGFAPGLGRGRFGQGSQGGQNPNTGQTNQGGQNGQGGTQTFRFRGGPELVEGVYFELRSPNGNVANRGFVFTTPDDQRTPPDLPASLHVEPNQNVVFDATAHDGDQAIPYRMIARGLSDGSMSITGLPTTDLAATQERLIQIELVATVSVLALVAVATWWLVGVGLAPLEKMESTAEKIAEGDLSQRIERAGPGTEIGRLGAALNQMLAEIEAAFSAKNTSERKLRRFVADASHELRTPLTSIRGYAELLRRGTLADPEEVTSAGWRIEREAKRLSSLVDDLLLLARLDEGVGMITSSVDLGRIALDVVADARVTDSDRVIAVSLPPGGPVVVDGDRNRLTQVVTNLVTNARDHTPPGTPIEVNVRWSSTLPPPPPRVEAPAAADPVTSTSPTAPAAEGPPASPTLDQPRLASSGPTTDQVVLEVVDHGPGIDPAAVALVFDRFFRTDESRSRDSGGVGLGLAIVAAILDAHRGRCEVVPTPGGGATFRVILPRYPYRPAPARHVIDEQAPLGGLPIDDLPEYVTEGSPTS